LEEMIAACHPSKPGLGERMLPFTRELLIDRSDFSEDSTLSRKKFKRLVLGEWIRLRGAYIIKADEVIKGDDGEISQINASLIPDTVGNDSPEGIRPRGVIHWVSAEQGVPVEIRRYDRLFSHESPDQGDEDFMAHINSESFSVITAVAEPSVADCAVETSFQFEREGYFVADRYDHTPAKPVFNMTIGLRDTWAGK